LQGSCKNRLIIIEVIKEKDTKRKGAEKVLDLKKLTQPGL
jgi:hypothetical protein